MRDQLLGSTQPVLSISLEPGESIVAAPGEFSWMTDSIQMSARSVDSYSEQPASQLERTLGGSSVSLSAYTAKEASGTIAFASKLPGSIVGIEVTPGTEYLVHRRGFLAGTPGIEITIGFQQPFGADGAASEEFVLRRISGRGRAWVELSGDVVKRELTAGTSLRTHPWHIGMFDATVVVQMAELQDPADRYSDNDAYHFAVLSGPGAVWLQSMPLLATPHTRLTEGQLASTSALEGDTGRAASQ